MTDTDDTRRSVVSHQLSLQEGRHRLNELHRQGVPIADADVARLSPLGDQHVNVHGRYTFTAAPSTELRTLRDPNTNDD